MVTTMKIGDKDMGYLVVIDRCYYPSVKEFDSKKDAEKHAEEVLDDEKDSTGNLPVEVYVVEVWSKTSFKSSY